MVQRLLDRSRARRGSPEGDRAGTPRASRGGTSACGSPRPRARAGAVSVRRRPVRIRVVGMSVRSPLALLGRERHLERAERAGAEGVIQRLPPARERVGRAHEVVEQGCRAAAISIARSNVRRRSPPTSSVPPVYAPTSSSSRNHNGVRSAPPPGIPDSTTRPPALVVRSARSSAPLEPTHSIATSTPPSRNSWPRSGVSFTACSPRRTAFTACSGRTTSVAPTSSRRLALPGMLGRHDHPARVRQPLRARGP